MNQTESCLLSMTFGSVVGIILMAVLMQVGGTTPRLKEMDSMIQSCEKDLPRSKYCVLIAVPQEKETNK